MSAKPLGYRVRFLGMDARQRPRVEKAPIFVKERRPRERPTLEALLADGLSSRSAAAILGLSLATVRAMRRRLDI